MLRKTGGALAAVVAALLIVACTTAPIMNVNNAPVTTTKGKVSAEQVRDAIIRAGQGLGWQMSPDRAGHITGTLALRTHVAVVDIDYSATSYSIKYRESTNLDAKDGQIHKNYNGWVQNLDNRIKSQLSAL